MATTRMATTMLIICTVMLSLIGYVQSLSIITTITSPNSAGIYYNATSYDVIWKGNNDSALIGIYVGLDIPYDIDPKWYVQNPIYNIGHQYLYFNIESNTNYYIHIDYNCGIFYCSSIESQRFTLHDIATSPSSRPLPQSSSSLSSSPWSSGSQTTDCWYTIYGNIMIFLVIITSLILILTIIMCIVCLRIMCGICVSCCERSPKKYEQIQPPSVSVPVLPV